MHKLSVMLITKNCESTIGACLKAVKPIADEIIILDSGSTDRTIEICTPYSEQIFSTDWPGFGPQKQRALEKCQFEWVLSLDSDEILTDACRIQIKQALNNSNYDAYRIKREMVFAGRCVRHSGCSDRPVRLFKRIKARFSDDLVHESVIISGKIGRIEQPMLHYSYQNIGDWVAKMNLYSDLAQHKSPRHKSYTVRRAIFSAGISFFKMYFLKKGFLEGRLGLVAAINAAVACYYKYIKLALDHEFTRP